MEPSKPRHVFVAVLEASQQAAALAVLRDALDQLERGPVRDAVSGVVARLAAATPVPIG